MLLSHKGETGSFQILCQPSIQQLTVTVYRLSPSSHRPTAIPQHTLLLPKGWSQAGVSLGLVGSSMGDLSKLSSCWKWCWWTSRGRSSLWSKKPKCPSAVMETLCCRRLRPLRWDVKLRSWRAMGIIDPIRFTAVSRGSLVSWPNSKPSSLNLPPNHPPVLLDKNNYLSLHLSWCAVNALVQNPCRASPACVLRIGGGWGVSPSSM